MESALQTKSDPLFQHVNVDQPGRAIDIPPPPEAPHDDRPNNAVLNAPEPPIEQPPSPEQPHVPSPRSFEHGSPRFLDESDSSSDEDPGSET